jgi:hypothetical protein
MTIVLMIIRQEMRGDLYNNDFSIPAAKYFEQNLPAHLKREVFAEKDAKKKVIEDRFDEELVPQTSGGRGGGRTRRAPADFINFIVHYGHGKTDALLGANNGPAIDMDTNNNGYLNNDGYLAGRTISTVSCHSFNGLGNNSKGKGYLGHDNIYWILRTNPTFLDELIAASTKANLELANGKTYGEAYQAQYDEYDALFNKYASTDSTAASMALQNRNTLKLKGDPGHKIE